MGKKKASTDTPYDIALKRIAECHKNRDRFLDLSYLGLTSVPSEIGQLSALAQLDISHNQLTALPREFGHFSSLTELRISRNQLTSLPREIGQLSALTNFYVGDNQLTALPPEIGQLSALTFLHVSRNELISLPHDVGRLSQLEHLLIENNHIQELPESLRKLSRLKELTLHGNEALNLPSEVLGPRYIASGSGNPPADPMAILDYYFSRRQDGEEPMREVRLLLVGRGRVGKTSLLKALRGEQPNETEPETPGITVQLLALKCKNGVATGHVWDFGGQEFLHGTHQIFLAERCVYLLVLEGRDGNWETETDYWLKFIQSFGGDSPVIVILTKYDQHKFSVDRHGLRERCPQIVGFVETDAFTPRGIPELTALIEQTVNDMHDVWIGVPRKWHRVKERLTALDKSFLEYGEYQALCVETGVPDDRNQDSLAQTMHRLGIALNFRDHQRLSHTCVLKPEWVTEAIYGLIRFVQERDSHGVLDTTWMKQALPSKDYPADKYSFVLDLMEKFEVAFPLDGTQNWLIPELLKEEQPEAFTEFRGPGVQRLRFLYPEALPPGLLPRFIVRTHDMSAAHPNWRWRTGVVLEWQGAKALVRLNRLERRTEIAIIEEAESKQERQEGRQSLFDLIRAHLAVLHGNVRVHEEVELIGNPDTWVRVSKLRRFEAKGTREIEEETKEGDLTTVKVTETLNAIESPQAREAGRDDDSRRMRLFVSYAHADAKLIKPLSTHLTILGQRGYIQVWQDTQLIAGEEWKERILEELERADIVVYLHSDKSCASNFIQTIEAPTAVKRAKDKDRPCTLIIVPLNRNNWDENDPLEKELKTRQTATWNAKPVCDFAPRSKGWQQVEESIRKAVEERRKRGK